MDLLGGLWNSDWQKEMLSQYDQSDRVVGELEVLSQCLHVGSYDHSNEVVHGAQSDRVERV